MRNRSRWAAPLILLVLGGASCSLSADGLASRAEEEASESGAPPSRIGSLPPSIDAGVDAQTASAPPVVIPPDAAATPPPMVAPPADAAAVAPDGPAMAPPMSPPMTPPPMPREVRARDVKVKRLIVGTAFVRKLEAKGGTVTRINLRPGPLLDLALGAGNLEVEELVADTLHARDVRAERVQIEELNAVEVKIGSEDD